MKKKNSLVFGRSFLLTQLTYHVDVGIIFSMFTLRGLVHVYGNALTARHNKKHYRD